MIRDERDPTDLGLSPELTSDALEAIAAAATALRERPASAEHRARVIERTAGERGWPSRRPRPVGRCRRPQCLAEEHQWCRRSARSGRVPGFVHDDR